MLQKLSFLSVTDASGAGWLQVYHVYGGSGQKIARPGSFTRNAVKTIAFYPLRIRGKRYRPLRTGFRVRSLLVHAAQLARFPDNTRCSFKTNTCVLLRKRGVFKSKYLYGPLPRLIRRKKYAALFKTYV
jgi:ribosomal protein L14